MANEEKKISFSAQDSGVSSFIKRLQADTKQLFSDFAKEAEKQTKNQKEQLKLIEQQIAAMERQNKLEREQTRLILERKREMGQLSDRAYNKSLSQLRDDARVSSLQGGMLGDMYQSRRNAGVPGPVEDEKRKESVFSGVLAATLFRDLTALIRQVPGARTDVDLISPFASIAGSGIGGGLGVLAEAATLGQIEFGVMGAQLGKEVGGFVGDAITRHLSEGFKAQQAEFSLRGRTGGYLRGGDLSALGYDQSESAQLELQLANAKMRGESSGTNVRRLAMVSRAYGLDAGMLANYEGTVSRMGGSQAGLNESRIITEAMKRGINQSSLPALFTNMNMLMGVMGQSRSGSADLDALQTTLEFNKVGGAFRLSDPRSSGLISTIQSNITNPNTPFAQALGYSVLRANNPNASYLDLLIERQKGGSVYAGQLMQATSRMFGGREDLAVPMLANTFGLQGNLEAARDLFRGGGNLGSLAGQDIAKTDMADLERKALAMTPEVDRIQASITNAFIKGADDGIFQVTSLFYDRMSAMIEKIATEQMVRMQKSFGITPKAPDKNGAPPGGRWF